MSKNQIVIKGAKENNLKSVHLTLQRDQLIVLTGLSGSGKSSLAFDTIYAEGQRRYVESLSSYARQFLGRMDKPDVEYIEGLSPSISIDQKTTSKNPRSTVGNAPPTLHGRHYPRPRGPEDGACPAAAAWVTHSSSSKDSATTPSSSPPCASLSGRDAESSKDGGDLR